MSSLRQPPARLVAQVRQVLGDDVEIDHIVVGHVGANPTWAMGLAAFSLVFVLFSEISFAAAAVLTVAYLATGLVWVRPSKGRLVAVTETSTVVFDATKIRFAPKSMLRELAVTHRLGPLTGALFGRIDVGDGERAWVSTGFRATVDEIDGVQPDHPASRSMPPKQRLFRLRHDDPRPGDDRPGDDRPGGPGRSGRPG